MIDVIKAQLEAAAASIAAARALMDHIVPSAQQAMQVDATMTMLSEPAGRKPACCAQPEPLLVPGRPGLTVCANCNHNEGDLNHV